MFLLYAQPLTSYCIVCSTSSSSAMFFPNSCYRRCLRAMGSSPEDQSEARFVQGTLSSCYLLLYLPGSVVSAGSFPLLSSGERWLSAGERRQRLCTVSIVWRDTWRTWETQCRCREEEWEGTHLRGLISFFSLSLTKVRLVFVEGPFRCRDICCREDRFSGCTLHWREGKGPQLKCFPSNCQGHLVTDAGCQNKLDF